MSYQQNLQKDEKIVERLPISWLSLVIPFLAMLCIIGIPWFFKQIIYLFTTELYITNQRICGRKGLFNTQTIDIPLESIDSMLVEHTLVGQIFNYGTMHFKCASGTFAFHSIAKPDVYKTLLMKEVDHHNETKKPEISVTIHNTSNN